MNFMLIRMFFMYFADFWAIFTIFTIFFLLFCFTASNGYWKDPYYLSNFKLTRGYSFGRYEAFFVEKYDGKRQNWNYFLIFCSFSVFICSLDKFLSLLWLAYCLASIRIPH